MEGTLLSAIPSDVIPVMASHSLDKSLHSLRAAGVITNDVFQTQMHGMCVHLLVDSEFQMTNIRPECDYYLVYRCLEYTPKIELDDLIEAYVELYEKSPECLSATIELVRDIMAFNIRRFVEVMNLLFKHLPPLISPSLIPSAVAVMNANDPRDNSKIVSHICIYCPLETAWVSKACTRPYAALMYFDRAIHECSYVIALALLNYSLRDGEIKADMLDNVSSHIARTGTHGKITRKIVVTIIDNMGNKHADVISRAIIELKDMKIMEETLKHSPAVKIKVYEAITQTLETTTDDISWFVNWMQTDGLSSAWRDGRSCSTLKLVTQKKLWDSCRDLVVQIFNNCSDTSLWTKMLMMSSTETYKAMIEKCCRQRRDHVTSWWKRYIDQTYNSDVWHTADKLLCYVPPLDDEYLLTHKSNIARKPELYPVVYGNEKLAKSIGHEFLHSAMFHSGVIDAAISCPHIKISPDIIELLKLRMQAAGVTELLLI